MPQRPKKKRDTIVEAVTRVDCHARSSGLSCTSTSRTQAQSVVPAPAALTKSTTGGLVSRQTNLRLYLPLVRRGPWHELQGQSVSPHLRAESESDQVSTFPTLLINHDISLFISTLGNISMGISHASLRTRILPMLLSSKAHLTR